ncbi:response regulator [Segnochrobactrum spirostomi]|uniref:Response regulator transcription factor n=1 Tax=Segnochrobactrum spirostomi TaxID=2608987 RepID=A0A6A7Y4D9_9HYPH|nr:response regulator transcription factor [Segnochrobactrum spirostomi]MQT13247.1 response regulator transcription factor [Segnochrobactrum spirostomi]
MTGSANLPADLPVLPDDAPHLLVVDDDSRIRGLIRRYLADNGYRVTVAEDSAEARRKIESLSFDALVVDVMMPGESGLSLTAALKARLDVPVLMLTARADPSHRIEGLETGADDYLTKPFEPRELLLRLANLLRRRRSAAPMTSGTVAFGPFQFDLDRQELSRDGAPVRLTDRERWLLKTFAEKPGETVARHLLAGRDEALSERTVDVQINRLRRKIEIDPANPVHLQTVRGIGYRLMAT